MIKLHVLKTRKYKFRILQEDITSALKKYKERKRFFKHDSGVGDEYWFFLSDFAIPVIQKSKSNICDGTFKKCPARIFTNTHCGEKKICRKKFIKARSSLTIYFF